MEKYINTIDSQSVFFVVVLDIVYKEIRKRVLAKTEPCQNGPNLLLLKRTDVVHCSTGWGGVGGK